MSFRISQQLFGKGHFSANGILRSSYCGCRYIFTPSSLDKTTPLRRDPKLPIHSDDHGNKNENKNKNKNKIKNKNKVKHNHNHNFNHQYGLGRSNASYSEKSKLTSKRKELESKRQSTQPQKKVFVHDLRSLTQEISTYVQYKELEEKGEAMEPEEIYRSISGGNEASNTKTESTGKELKLRNQIPEEISNKLGLVMEFSSSNGTGINWPTITDQLSLSGGFQGLSSETVNRFISLIPLQSLNKMRPSLLHMCKDAQVDLSSKVETKLFKSMALGDRLSDTTIQEMEEEFEKLQASNRLKTEHFETMALAYVKNQKLEKVDSLIQTMKLRGLEIGRSIFTSILIGYTYYEKNVDKALQTFEAMKFLSKKTAPTSQNYKDIIAACTMNGKIELALNFYQDMLEQNTQVNQTVLAMLAKGCIKNNALVPKAWEFIFKIYDFSWSPSLDTYETMLYISAREGDANLTRALFFKLLQSGSVTPRAAFYLMMSYSRYSEKKNNTGFYSITNSERGRLFRDHIINDVDYTKSVFEFPMLPLNNLHSEELILAEALAVWSFFSINKPSFLTPQLLSCYLTAVLNHGKLNDFKNVFEDCTYAEVSLPSNRQQVDQTGKVVQVDQDTESEENETKQDKQANHATTSTFDIQIANLNSSLPQQANNLHKLPRESIVYKIAMRAAAKFRDGEFADNIIAERGLYRKSKSYKLLPKRKQIALDFEFACSTVHYYTDVGLFNDALAVILSSEDTFNWSWKEVGKLINTAASLHDTKTVETAKSIIKRVKLRQHSL